MKLVRLIAPVFAGIVAAVVSAQFMGSPTPQRPKFADKEDVEVKFEVDKVTFDDLVKKLSETTKVLILVDDDLKEQYKDSKFSMHEQGKVSALIFKLAYNISATPQTAIIFCTKEQKPEREPILELPDKKVTAKLPEMDTATVLSMVGTAGGVPLYATPEVLKEHAKLSVDFDEKPVKDAIAEIAKKLEAVAARGIYLKKFDREAAFKQFLSLPTQQQEQIMLQMANRMRQSGMSQSQIDKAIDQAIQRFFQQSPEKRREISQRMSNHFHQLAGAVRQFSPETIRQLREVWRPFIRRAVSRIRSLPPNQQAELAPILRAIDELPFAR